MNNNQVTPILPKYINRNIITLGEMINEINFPTIAGGFLHILIYGAIIVNTHFNKHLNKILQRINQFGT